MSGPLINTKTGEIIHWDEDLSPEENRRIRDELMGWTKDIKEPEED